MTCDLVVCYQRIFAGYNSFAQIYLKMALESRVIQVFEEGATSKIPALVSCSDRTGNEMLIFDEL